MIRYYLAAIGRNYHFRRGAYLRALREWKLIRDSARQACIQEWDAWIHASLETDAWLDKQP